MKRVLLLGISLMILAGCGDMSECESKGGVLVKGYRDRVCIDKSAIIELKK